MHHHLTLAYQAPPPVDPRTLPDSEAITFFTARAEEHRGSALQARRAVASLRERAKAMLAQAERLEKQAIEDEKLARVDTRAADARLLSCF